MTAGFMACCKEKPAVIDRRYSRKARVHGIEFVNEFPTQDTRWSSVYQFATLELTKSREWLNLDAANALLGDNLAIPVAPSQWDLVLSTPDDVWSHEFFEFFYFKLDFLHSSSSVPYLCTLAKYIIMNSTNASDGAGQRKRNVPDVAAVVSYCAV